MERPEILSSGPTDSVVPCGGASSELRGEPTLKALVLMV